MRAALALAVAALMGGVGATPVAARAQGGGGSLDLHELAVGAYRDGDHEAARSLWIEALEVAAPRASLDRAAILYDLGNAAWRLDRGLEAVAWYTAALDVDPRHADARANLEFVRGELDLEPADRGDLESTVDRTLSFLTLAEAEWGVLAALVLLFGAMAYEALRGGAAGRRLVMGGLVLVVLALVPWLHQVRAAGQDRVMVVAAGGAAVRSEPGGEAATIAELAPAETAVRLDAQPGWVRVELPGGERGWAPEDVLFPLAVHARP